MLTFTGTGSTHCMELGNCCAFMSCGKDLVLLDCGEDTFASPLLQQALHGCRGEIWCLLTHLHGDHAGSLATLCLYSAAELGKRVRICYPSSGAAALLNLMGVLPEYIELYVHFPLQLSGGLIAYPVPTEHVDWMECYGYLLQTAEGSCYYSGDARMIPEGILEGFQQGKVGTIYQDVCLYGPKGGPHLTLEELCEIIPDQAQRSRIWVMHLDSLECARMAREHGFRVAEKGVIS